MTWSLPVLAFMVILSASLCPCACSQQCTSMMGTPLEACNVAGYNSTFPMSYKLTNNTKGWVSSFLKFVLRMTQSNNCSAGLQQMGEMITCAIYVPRCTNGNLVLPCKRVCVEYFTKCNGHIDPFWFDYFVAHCTLLDDYKASSGKCFEPPNFDQRYNVTSGDVLQGKCHKVIFPWCKGLGFEYTIMKESTQITYYKYLYGKDFTNNSSVDNIILNTSALNYWLRFQRNYSVCAIEIQKTLCSDLFPPCYPKEGTSLYTVCQQTCLDMRKKCPSIADHHTFLGNFFDSCESWASGRSVHGHGYCKHTTWPKPLLWIEYFKERMPKPSATPPTTLSTTPVYVIVIAVIVPLVLISLIVAAVLLWRQRKLLWFVRMFKKSDDTKDIVQGEPEIQVEAS